VWQELAEKAGKAQASQMALQSLYAKPPPLWLHPAFIAEFGDAFVSGTGLDTGALSISIEVAVLALQA